MSLKVDDYLFYNPAFKLRDALKNVVHPASLGTTWIDLEDGNRAVVRDAATITAPVTEINSFDNRLLINTMGGFTTMAVRWRYDKDRTVSTAPVVQFFGRMNVNEVFQRLYNLADTALATLTLTGATSDIIGGSYRYTDVVAKDHELDIRGFNEIVWGTLTAGVLSGAADVASFLQVRLY